MSAPEPAAFGVYVHWPFCLSKCPYCDFNSHVRHAAIDEERFVRAFAREIETTAARTPGRTVSSIFLGGGTPSLMQPQTVGAVLDAIGKHWSVARDVEVTLEANPTSVEATRFHGYRKAGVNRVSLGVQALDDASLKALGRMHTAREALDAVAIARSAFERYSFDLIYARPDQTVEAWSKELRLAITEAAEHLSLYQLTIEPETPFAGLYAAGKLVIPDEGNARALYDATQEICASLGLPAYEISNHARPGAECRHNLVYWRGDEYAGIGPGAHGRHRYRWHAPCNGDRKAARGLADARRAARPRRRHRRCADQRRARRRISADGSSPARRHRPAALSRAGRPHASTRAASICSPRKARSPSTATAACASRRRVFRFSTPWSPTSRLKKRYPKRQSSVALRPRPARRSSRPA